MLAFVAVALIACSWSAEERAREPVASAGAAVELPASPAVDVLPAGLDEEQTVAALRARPSWAPLLTSEAACPTSTSRPLPAPVAGDAYGDGPLYLLADGTGRAVLTFDERGAVKAIWQLTGASQGPVRIRGANLRGGAELRFEDGARELVLPHGGAPRGPGAVAGWRDFPSLIRIAEPGCYALQLDGPDFSSLIVFEAHSEPSSR